MAKIFGDKLSLMISSLVFLASRALCLPKGQASGRSQSAGVCCPSASLQCKPTGLQFHVKDLEAGTGDTRWTLHLRLTEEQDSVGISTKSSYMFLYPPKPKLLVEQAVVADRSCMESPLVLGVAEAKGAQPVINGD